MRDFRAKAAVQLALSYLPGGARLNGLFQRRITRALPSSDDQFRDMVENGARHLSYLRGHLRRPLSECTFYEFGAGWELVVPLTLYCAGVDKQIVIDLRPNA